MKKTQAIIYSLIGLTSSAFSQVVLELGSDSLIDPTIAGNTRATLNAIGTIVDPDQPNVALSTVNFSIDLDDGVPVGDSTFFDNGSSSHFEDNSSPRWSSNNFQNVDGSNVGTNLDTLGLRTTGVIGPKGTITISFTNPVEDLALHLWNLDAGDVFLDTVNGSTDFTAIELSGNLATIPGGVLGTELLSGTEINAGNGSLQFNPADGNPISSITLRTADDGTTDGWSLFISGAQVVPEPSSVALLGLGGLALLGRRKRA